MDIPLNFYNAYFLIRKSIFQSIITFRQRGITAYNFDDATKLMKEVVFKEHVMPGIKRIIAHVDIRTLDQGHVIPNMTSPAARGVWFPTGC